MLCELLCAVELFLRQLTGLKHLLYLLTRISLILRAELLPLIDKIGKAAVTRRALIALICILVVQ